MTSLLKLFGLLILIILLLEFHPPSKAKSKPEKTFIPLKRDYHERVDRVKKIRFGRIDTNDFIPSYPSGIEVSHAENLKINGVASKIKCFKTKDRPQRVINHYSSRWKAEGRKIYKNESGGCITLSSFNVINKTFETIIARGEYNSGMTQVSHTVMMLDKFKKNTKSGNVPGFINNGKNLHMESLEGNKETNTFIDFMETNSINCMNYYSRNMKKEGWKEYSNKSSLYKELEKNSFLFFTKGDAECLINFQPDGEQKGTLIFINLTVGHN
ncbi:MAG: hypothetical protein SV062_13965 [Thermodesulfobacteriota bacterium]|nr:hypothetical protein [Thermodesulfobacteriota bacterium]